MAQHIVVRLQSRVLELQNDNTLVRSYPIAIGRRLSKTPVGEYMIVNKVPNPGGPYGAFWLGLSRQHYGIHGTPHPSLIGKAVSHGCIRMTNTAVTDLANRVIIGTPVSIRPT